MTCRSLGNVAIASKIKANAPCLAASFLTEGQSVDFNKLLSIE